MHCWTHWSSPWSWRGCFLRSCRRNLPRCWTPRTQTANCRTYWMPQAESCWTVPNSPPCSTKTPRTSCWCCSNRWPYSNCSRSSCWQSCCLSWTEIPVLPASPHRRSGSWRTSPQRPPHRTLPAKSAFSVSFGCTSFFTNIPLVKRPCCLVSVYSFRHGFVNEEKRQWGILFPPNFPFL